MEVPAVLAGPPRRHRTAASMRFEVTPPSCSPLSKYDPSPIEFKPTLRLSRFPLRPPTRLEPRNVIIRRKALHQPYELAAGTEDYGRPLLCGSSNDRKTRTSKTAMPRRLAYNTLFRNLVCQVGPCTARSPILLLPSSIVDCSLLLCSVLLWSLRVALLSSVLFFLLFCSVTSVSFALSRCAFQRPTITGGHLP